MGRKYVGFDISLRPVSPMAFKRACTAFSPPFGRGLILYPPGIILDRYKKPNGYFHTTTVTLSLVTGRASSISSLAISPASFPEEAISTIFSSLT